VSCGFGRLISQLLNHLQNGGYIADIKSVDNKKAEPLLTSRSLNVLKKNEKGLLTEDQRSFFLWKISSTNVWCDTAKKA
jgi:ribosomal protein S8